MDSDRLIYIYLYLLILALFKISFFFYRILVLDNGEIAEFAPPETLLDNPDSLFYSLSKEAGLVD